MLRKAILVLFALHFGMLWAGSEQSISVVIVDQESNTPISDAIVVLKEAGKHAYSDQSGEARFANTEPAVYNLEITRLGYASIKLTHDFTGKADTPLKISMEPRPLPVEDILVDGTSIPLMEQTNVYEEIIDRENPGDVGEFLKHQPGFAAIRRGGYAIDPVMRGLKHEQLNVQFDGGTRVSHACPNRMDPVTTHVPVQELEKIEIIKGPYAVRYGQTFGGVINLVTKRPQYSGEFALKGELESRYESNNGQLSQFTLSGGNRRFDMLASAGSKDFGNYQDGNGSEVPSAYRVNDYAVKAGINYNAHWRSQFSFRQSFTRDVLHAGLQMDTDEDNSTLWSLDFTGGNFDGPLSRITGKVYGSNVDHVMTNRLRPNAAMIAAEAAVTSEMLGGRLEAQFRPGLMSVLYLGMDVDMQNNAGTRERLVSINPCNGMVMDPARSFTDAIWQDAWRQQIGVFAEFRRSLNDNLMAVAGLRADRVSSQADDPAQQFTDRYGDPGEQSDGMVSAALSLDYQFRPSINIQFSAGRGVRAPSIAERYINHLSLGPDPYEYVGNPYLSPEVNHQIDLSMKYRGKAQGLQINTFYSQLTDHIVAAVDPTINRLFMPCMMPQNARRFQNVGEARQIGFEVKAYRDLPSALKLSIDASYTRSENLDWDEPLPEVPPLQSVVRLSHQSLSGRLWTEINGRFVADQERISSSFGEQRTSGFAVYNWRILFDLHNSIRVGFSALNIFDRDYREHLNRLYRNSTQNGYLLEPGRNFQVSLILRN